MDAGDVAGGRDHAALAAADDHRPVGELGSSRFSIGGVEGVAVEMGDGEAVEFGMDGEPGAAASRRSAAPPPATA